MKQNKKQLKAYNLNAKAFDFLLTEYGDCIEIPTDDFSNYTCGYRKSNTIIYDGCKKLVILECNLWELFKKLGWYDTIYELTDWKQCICYKRESQTDLIEKSITGGMAYRTVYSNLNKYYTDDEIEQRLNMFTADYDEELIQIHFNYTEEAGKIEKWENCVKYDINGAYAAAIIEIFPKAEDYILNLYNKRKERPINKQYINYFIGMLARNGHRKTFNYVVQKIRKLMEETIDETDGILIYANTDGFAVSDPVGKPRKVGKELGDFKIEYQGDIYVYEGDNYWIMQCGDKITGNVLWQVRDQIDLRIGKAVKYNRVKRGHSYVAENVEVISV
ncbi:MAG: hypothetical protein IKT93_02360 [Clostridia bacterium]|nr:hypothetical protein [Clostridia bacterium]